MTLTYIFKVVCYKNSHFWHANISKNLPTSFQISLRAICSQTFQRIAEFGKKYDEFSTRPENTQSYILKLSTGIITNIIIYIFTEFVVFFIKIGFKSRRRWILNFGRVLALRVYLAHSVKWVPTLMAGSPPHWARS